VTWSEQDNIKWKVSIPGQGHSSPVVWGDRIFVSTAVPQQPEVEASAQEPAPGQRKRSVQPAGAYDYTVMALSRLDGSIVWRRVARSQQPHESTHPAGSWASASPVTDGVHLYASFGSVGVFCFDLDGKLIWETDLGDMQTRRGFGEGSSPALHGDALVINWDHEGQSFIVALEKNTGAQLWKRQRDEATSWSTPLIVEVDGTPQVVTNATNRIRAYELATGRLLWESGGMTVNAIPTPVALGDMVFVTSGFRGNALMAIRLSAANGDITGTDAVAWSRDEDTPYIPSPLLYDETLYLIKRNGNIVSAVSASDGTVIFDKQRLDGIDGVYASPVGGGDHVYVVGTNGATAVLRHGARFNLVATNQLDDSFSASPAISGDQIFLRGHQSLYCIASP
jgi:outer membrane protein assembly factor BamB